MICQRLAHNAKGFLCPFAGNKIELCESKEQFSF